MPKDMSKDIPRLRLRLRSLPLLARLGISLMLFTLLGGMLASGVHLWVHHENRDDQPGLSLDDLKGVYHGVRSRALLVTALERGHPEDLADQERQLLLGWLAGNRIAEDYDNLDLGDSAPAEILAASCLSCHSRNAKEGEAIGQELPLDYWDDVEKLASSRDVRPMDPSILLASTHTHALSLAVIALLLTLLGLATRFSRGLVSSLVGLAGLGLFVDLACWWLARESALFVPILIGAGCLFVGCSTVLALLSLLELWLPEQHEQRAQLRV